MPIRVQAVQRNRRLSAALIVGLSLLASISIAADATDPSAPPKFELERTLEGHSTLVWCVAFSPDGKVVASGGNAEVGAPVELKLWDLSTGEAKVTLTEARAVVWVSFSP